jgi:predicted phage terminase large subunit-like protein
VIVMTRWSLRDLTAQVLKSAANRGGEEWKVIELPAILPSDKPLWPEFWSETELKALREELPSGKWMAQYQQQPTSDTNAIIKRDWWQWWEGEQPPSCTFIIQSWDTAHETKKVNDYSAVTTWGVFYNDEDRGLPNLILLNAAKKRVEFPELKKWAYEEWEEWDPDSFLVEKKAAGAPLIQEFRAMGIPVQEYSPGKGQDKITRLNSVADLFASGKVWAPQTRWAEELVDEVASFPSGEHDDLVDSMTLALMRFRSGGYLRLPNDEADEVKFFKGYRREKYYTV